MSGAACAKKAACNPPVTAAVETADRHTELLTAAVKDQLITDEEGDELILEYADNDDSYCARAKEISGRVIKLLARAEGFEAWPPGTRGRPSE